MKQYTIPTIELIPTAPADLLTVSVESNGFGISITLEDLMQ